MIDLIGMARQLRPRLRVRTAQGQPIAVGQRQITPVMRSVALAVGGPGRPITAGLAWSWPVAVLDTWHGQTERIPIPNVMRRITLALLASTVLLAVTTACLRRRHESRARSMARWMSR